MQPLPVTFDEGRFRYDQVIREGLVALYTQTHKRGTMRRYEVVRIREAPPHTWPNGTTSPAREVYPGASAWGRDGWTFLSLAPAMAFYQYLCTRQATAAQEMPHA